MSKALRLSEKLFRFGLWIVAFVCAGFLIGLGGRIVANMPLVEKQYEVEDFIDKAAQIQAKAAIAAYDKPLEALDAKYDKARKNLQEAQANSRAAKQSFNNWIATRQATDRSSQDSAVIERTKQLDNLAAIERAQSDALDKIDDERQQLDKQLREKDQVLRQLQADAQEKLFEEQRRQELRTFGYRLALTLPLLVLAGWLLAKKRQSTYWPFVWGFVIFAGFTFFFELVPYLPSYGGYVRYSVGIIVTVIVGRQAIISLNAYLARQKIAEQLPSEQRRNELSYDVALSRLVASAKSI